MKQEIIKSILENKKWLVNGIEIPLTKEQLAKLKGLIKKPIGKMDRPSLGEYYFVIAYSVQLGHYVAKIKYRNDLVDNQYFNYGNCYLDEELAEQIAMDRNLTDKLRQFSYDNGWQDEYLFDLSMNKYSIFFNIRYKNWDIMTSGDAICPDKVYFKDIPTCEKAIKEIIKPFCKENPTYRFNKGE